MVFNAVVYYGNPNGQLYIYITAPQQVPYRELPVPIMAANQAPALHRSARLARRPRSSSSTTLIRSDTARGRATRS
ncbi:predicted protein [Plenodomus lingam JN3]|uniref:Predicted protein n=1 Tax=Leptosphaeria maculans (strain JN3 / isolate v23.1.3 / race Av1-4-5-6-7-8) TaxID=985895 RepID=E4ZNE3_LEPMJ|nr:predicted protein [Plenodomus lingam JN3]CBX93002.1 predicted protein [Plenodomus lingam JN3]